MSHKNKAKDLIQLLKINENQIMEALSLFCMRIGLSPDQNIYKFDENVIIKGINFDRLNNNPVKITDKKLLAWLFSLKHSFQR